MRLLFFVAQHYYSTPSPDHQQIAPTIRSLSLHLLYFKGLFNQFLNVYIKQQWKTYTKGVRKRKFGPTLMQQEIFTRNTIVRNRAAEYRPSVNGYGLW